MNTQILTRKRTAQSHSPGARTLKGKPLKPISKARSRAVSKTQIKPKISKGQNSNLFWLLLVVVLGIAILGLIMILSASSHTALETRGSTWFWFHRQLIWFGAGLAALFLGMRVHYHTLKKIAKPLLLVSALLMVLVLVPQLGITSNGATRWLGIGSISIQPVELVKLSLIIYFAQLLDFRRDRVKDPKMGMYPVFVVLAFFLVLLLLQPDLGSSIVLGVVSIAILYAAGAAILPLSLWTGGAMVSVLLLSLQASYRRRRLLAFLDPWDDPLNTGYQTIQSLVAVASGGVWGRGLGAGRAKWGYLPYAHTDFIFSVIAEELGLVGAGLLLAAFATLSIGGILVAIRAPDMYGTILSTGIIVWIMSQTFLNIGAAVGSLPITGVPLPLVSFGGSSLVVTMAAVGILLNVARHSKPR